MRILAPIGDDATEMFPTDASVAAGVVVGTTAISVVAGTGMVVVADSEAVVAGGIVAVIFTRVVTVTLGEA
jgi:hypothetical protein